MLLFTICSILGDISLGLSTTETLGSVRSRHGQQQRPEQNLRSFVYPMKLTCLYRRIRLLMTNKAPPVTRSFQIAIATLSLMAQTALSNAGPIEDRLLACAGEVDDSSRLRCFDDVAGELAVADTPSVPPEAAPVAEVAVAAAITEASLSDVEQFGMTVELAEEKAGVGGETELLEISTVAVEVTERIRGELVVTLDNGQIWTEKDSKAGFRVKAGDTVVIRKGRLGGYRMVDRSGRASAVVRVE
jgi:hypothetical protein